MGKFSSIQLILLANLLCGCAASPINPAQVNAAGTTWRTRAGDAIVLSQPSWGQTLAVCVNADSLSPISVFVRDRPSLRQIYDTAPHLAAGQCVLASVGREQDLMLRQLGNGPDAEGHALPVSGVGYHPAPPTLPLSVRLARAPHRLHGLGAR